MLPVSALAQKALDAIQAAMPQGETHFERGQAVINLMKLVPSGSALGRALLMEKVWPSAIRDQHVRAWSGKEHYSYLRQIGSGGFQIHYFLEMIDRVAATDGSTQIEERHVARALVGDDSSNLRDIGINGTALVGEVTQQEAARPSAPQLATQVIRLERLHELIQQAAGRRFASGHYEDAIFAAFRSVEARVRTLSGLDASGRDLVARAFGGDPPLIRIGASQDRSGRDEQEGFQLIFMGAIQGIRNPKAHSEIEQGDPQRTLEYLALASLLMRRLDDAIVSGRT